MQKDELISHNMQMLTPNESLIKCEAKTMKLLEEDTQVKFQDFGRGKDFLDTALKHSL